MGMSNNYSRGQVAMGDLLVLLCGTTEEDRFPLWINGSVGHCFNQVALNLPSHALLAMSSAFFMGKYRRDSHVPVSYGWVLRILTSALVVALFFCDLVSLSFDFDVKTRHLDVMAACVAAFAWLCHSLALSSVAQSELSFSRGPPLIIVVWLATIPSAVINGVAFFTRPEFCLLGAAACMHKVVMCGVPVFMAVYLISLIPSNRLVAVHEVESINDAGERTALLGSRKRKTEQLFPDARHRQAVTEDGSGFISKLFYIWLNPVMKQGYNGELNSPDDILELPENMKVSFVSQAFKDVLYADSNQTRDCIPEDVSQSSPIGKRLCINKDTPLPDSQPRRTLFWSLYKVYGVHYLLIGLLYLIAIVLGLLGPVILQYLLSFMENRQEPASHGYYYIAGLFGTTFFGAFFNNQFSYRINKIALCVRAALVTTVYRKSLRVGASSLSEFSTGEIVNYMSTDTDRIVNFCPSFHSFWSLPLQVAVSLLLLYQQVGVAFLAGIAVAILLVPLNKLIANKIGGFSQAMMHHKDGRVKLMTEILFGIRAIKLHCWEESFSRKVNGFRSDELKGLSGMKYLDALCVYLWAVTPVLISILTFVTYVSLGNALTATKVFTAVALINMLITPLNAFPWVLNGLIEARISLRRLETFLSLPEFSAETYYCNSKSFYEEAQSGEWEVALCRATLSWGSLLCPPRQRGSPDPAAEGFSLKRVEFRVKEGQLVGVVGKVGSGKSSLLAAITGDLFRCRGGVLVKRLEEGFGLFTQETWIQHGTVRDNILFGSRYDEDKYLSIIRACALSEDLKTLVNGDRTEVGENGVTLSGGQKARIALARVAYSDKPVCLLDDPLAAVDCDVAAHLFSKCINGLLQKRTRILCTHRTQYLAAADLVILLDNGIVIKAGPPHAVLPAGNALPDWPLAVEAEPHSDGGGGDECEGDADCVAGAVAAGACGGGVAEGAGGGSGGCGVVAEVRGGGVAGGAGGGGGNVAGEAISGGICGVADGADGGGVAGVVSEPLVQQEERMVGAVALGVWLAYWRAVGSCLSVAVILALFLMQATRNVTDWWLSYWIAHVQEHKNASFHDNFERSSANGSDPVQFYLSVYGALAAGNTVFTLLRAFLFAYGGVCAARNIHSALLHKVLQAPVSFFDATPTGRIMNRFSSDLFTVDDSLPFIMNIFLAQLFGLVGAIVVMCYGLPWMALVLLPLAGVYFCVQKYYRFTSRELKRLGSVTLSPIYSHFAESLSGLAVIKAFRATDRFTRENEARLELNQRCQFAAVAVMQWLDVRLQMMGVVIVVSLAALAVLEHHLRGVDPGLVGLAIAYALSINGRLSGLVSSFTQTETQMVSVERVQEYRGIDSEEAHRHPTHVSPDWPQGGALKFDKVFLTYRPGLPFALNGISFCINPWEKVGIVGRTGSGKSTLFSVLFRIVDVQHGAVYIDDQDISKLALKQLRSNLAIIPQDPFLFSDTVRNNLDPKGSYQDHELWEVLEKCHLKSFVLDQGGLQAEVAERGRDFSCGQRQLLCLARAMLFKAKILCIDEATASVDQDTDVLLQKTIRSEFVNSTVLTIAHRPNTILDSDRVLLLRGGRVLEFASPHDLLQDPRSALSRLLSKSHLLS
ncbi:ATP-binding cassette sub-family C member 10 isoform X3 [Lethenteron reissneri]|uniref:ATP-binding cassette sub-family C member 10 isoform X3 n=1 Tax=Lethenteron reissneri TaxID=7753 RepID=UPI002AB7A4FA|nr:ATP-binding cassette sub-family C member 10 isoform X3 [Lethenteron reissneri]